MERVHVSLEVNGTPRDLLVWPHQTLLQSLRDEAGATEVKYGCGEGVCGTCTVLLDGETVNACLLFAVQAAGRRVTTVRGLLGADGGLHPLQRSFLRHGASQCGFCTPGMLLTAREFAQKAPGASREDIRRALGGNLCRCTGYTKILDAVEEYVRGDEASPQPRASASGS
jgi:aerobic carbon-monoxide dehydrogenase small subunit